MLILNYKLIWWVGTDVTVIDLQGDLVVPGFVDSHVHIIGAYMSNRSAPSN